MSHGLAEAGATVLIAARNAKKSKAAAEPILASGGRVSAIAVDVTSQTACEAVVAAATAAHGRLDMLINNSGINISKRPEAYALGEWQQVLGTNLTSAFLCAQAAYPEMQKQPAARLSKLVQ